jgi:hypothetical protein
MTNAAVFFDSAVTATKNSWPEVKDVLAPGKLVPSFPNPSCSKMRKDEGHML